MGSLLLPVRVSIFSSDSLWLIFALIEYNLNIPFVCEKATNNYLGSQKKKKEKKRKKEGRKTEKKSDYVSEVNWQQFLLRKKICILFILSGGGIMQYQKASKMIIEARKKRICLLSYILILLFLFVAFDGMQSKTEPNQAANQLIYILKRIEEQCIVLFIGRCHCMMRRSSPPGGCVVAGD